MKTAGIIAEYNPFHNGHAYHIEETRKKTGADYIVAIMSGSFVQRGTPALCDKHLRAEAALKNGVDLVLELPVSYAVGSAEIFSRGAVEILDRLGIVDILSFGAETDDIEELSTIADFLLQESEEYRAELQKNLAQGQNFARARAAAIPKIHADIFSSPNAILGIEYLKALKRRHSRIEPVVIQRKGAGYHDRKLFTPVKDTGFSSASSIRHALLAAGNEASRASAPLLPPDTVPADMLDALTALYNAGVLLCEDDFSELLHYKILTQTEEALCLCPSVSPDLARRIKRHQYRFQSFSSFADLVKCKNYTHSRIRRALCEILLDLKAPEPITQIRVLGCRKSALPLLSAIAEKGTLPLITSLSKAECFWQSDILYDMVLAHKAKAPMTPEPSKGMKIVEL